MRKFETVDEVKSVTAHEVINNIILNALNTLRTQQIQEERPTEPVDELISRVAYAPTKKVKVAPCKCHEER